MKKLIAIATLSMTIVVLSQAPARADRKTMEGFLLGTGAVILGSAIIKGLNCDSSRPRYSAAVHVPDRHYPPGPQHRYNDRRHPKYAGNHHRPRGHWEIEKKWVEPVYETKWNPGHYDRSGIWVSGRYEKFIVQDGYWQENKVWVERW